jgi:hypothetical protein
LLIGHGEGLFAEAPAKNIIAMESRFSSHLFYRAETISLHFAAIVPKCSGVATEIYERTSTMETNALNSFLEEKLVADNGYAASNWRQCEAERKLLVAVLKDAILSYKKNVSLGGARFKEAERWIFGKDTDRLFAFETVCSTLGLSAQRIRAELVTFAAVKYAPAIKTVGRASLSF